MEKPKAKKPNKSKNQKSTSNKKNVEIENDDLDFGGLPKGIDLKKNLGCGG